MPHTVKSFCKYKLSSTMISGNIIVAMDTYVAGIIYFTKLGNWIHLLLQLWLLHYIVMICLYELDLNHCAIHMYLCIN